MFYQDDLHSQEAVQGYSPEHTQGRPLCHEPSHEPSHDPSHDPSHAHRRSHAHAEGPSSPEEVLALLTYMAGHNRHHAAELHELAHSTDGEAARLLHDAVASYESGNAKLEAALDILKKQGMKTGE